MAGLLCCEPREAPGNPMKAWGCDKQLLSVADHCDTHTFMLASCWLDSGSVQAAGSTAVTDHYGYELSTDSGLSEDVCLACDELLVASPPKHPSGDSTQPCIAKQSTPPQSHDINLCTLKLLGCSSVAQDVRETIRNEMKREAETRPCSHYFHRLGVSKELRLNAVSWAVQIVDSFSQQQETLFLAISYLDRFLSVTQDVVHMDGLQLATLACLSLASKQTEVTQPASCEWTCLLNGHSWGTKEQLARMEWIVMDNLDWRGCTPTAWWFLHLFCYGLGTCPAQSICMAAYLLELGLLESGCLAYSYSALAAAALLLGHAYVDQHLRLVDAALLQPLTVHALLALAPELNLHQVQGACEMLASLHTTACQQPENPQDQPRQGMQLVRAKYCADVWHRVGSWSVPVGCMAALERL